MRAQADRLEDKRYLKKLTEALNISEDRIHLDECGDWNIFGRRGKISTETEYWYLYTECFSARKWNNTKRKLSFMEVHQDGDTEGVLKCSRMPTEKEANEVRKVIGVRSRVKLTEEDLALLKNRLKFSSSKGVSASRIDLNHVPGRVVA